MGLSESEIFPVKDALEMVLIFDGAGKIAYANDAAEKGLEYDGNLQEEANICDIFPNEFKLEEGMLSIECPMGLEVQKLVAYRKNYTCFPVKARIIKSQDHPGMFICMADDTMEKEYLSREIIQAQQKAQEAQKVKTEFVANVTHELRTPVNGVLGNVRELMEEEKDPRKSKFLWTISRCCEDMNKIIDNILDFSKLDAGKFTLEPRRFNTREMLDYVKANHASKITEKGLEFFMTVSPQVPEYVIGDELRIGQILNNLLSNALKFTAAGKVSLEVLKTAQVNNKVELFFVVVDSGIGIDKADKDKLFESFSQVDASISRKYGGTGLGLNICRQLVELMGGTVGVESEKGKGSAFSFSVWVESCEEGGAASQTDSLKKQAYASASMSALAGEGKDRLKQFGTPENQEALKRNLSKLILCVEMENWEKAEMFMETIRQLSEGAPREIGRILLRLKMAVQKENYDKVAAGYEELKAFLQAEEVQA